MSLKIERAVTVLPEPDSPTRPSVSPSARSNETPSTARATPASVRKLVERLRTLSNVVTTSEGSGPRVTRRRRD